ncbi:calphotin-like [Eriocheir sinensis]|uniref:calphotin-like n=1 Tax=Eriocheir sinensis TaxID=95602 RepID=UPI0021C74A5F|nr:calphotin-like [Eriocheir sinensis]
MDIAVPPVPAASSPAVAGSTPVLHQILAAVTQLQETLAATISRVAALEQRVSTPPPVREISSIPAPAPASASAPCPALPSAGEAMDADSGDSVVPPAGQMQNTPATPPAVVTAAAEGTAEPRHGQTGPSPSPADPPLQWEATLQVLLAQFASLTQQVAELHHRITPLLDRQPPPPDQCLLSDHFALETTIPIQPAPAVSRKRLAVPAARMPRLVAEVGAWYHTVKGSFTDAASLYHGLLDTVESFVAAGRAPPRPAKRRLQTYASDPAVSNCQRTLASYHRRWQQDPADRAARDAMVAVARHLTELRQEARVRGRTKRLVSDSDPAGRAQDLMRQWQRASSLGGLPAQHQAELARHRERRMALVQHHVTLLDDTCVPITHDELLLAVKHG